MYGYNFAGLTLQELHNARPPYDDTYGTLLKDEKICDKILPTTEFKKLELIAKTNHLVLRKIRLSKDMYSLGLKVTNAKIRKSFNKSTLEKMKVEQFSEICQKFWDEV